MTRVAWTCWSTALSGGLNTPASAAKEDRRRGAAAHWAESCPLLRICVCTPARVSLCRSTCLQACGRTWHVRIGGCMRVGVRVGVWKCTQATPLLLLDGQRGGGGGYSTGCTPEEEGGGGGNLLPLPSPPPGPKSPSSGKTKCNIGKMWSAHRWYTNFWVPPSPPPSNTSPGVGGELQRATGKWSCVGPEKANERYCPPWPCRRLHGYT